MTYKAWYSKEISELKDSEKLFDLSRKPTLEEAKVEIPVSVILKMIHLD